MTTNLILNRRRGAFLLATAWSAAQVLAGPPSTPQGVITAKGFLDIGSGTAVTDLTGNAKFPDHPDVVYYYPYFEWNATGDINTAPADYGDNYGDQTIGYFYPPVTGDYVFLLASDDNSNLYLSTDETAANKKLIAQQDGYSAVRAWDTVGSGTVEKKNSQTFAGTEWPTKDPAGGAKITLTKGKIYYIEALHKEGTGDDFLAVAVQAPDGSIDSTLPIPGQYLSTFDKNSGPATVTTQPQSQTIAEAAPVTFTVGVDGTPPYSYQWSKNGTAIPDGTNASYTISHVSRADTGAKFKVTVTGPAGTGTSADATLTVMPDNTPPTVLLVTTHIGVTVQVQFSEYMDAASTTNKANYAIANVTITDVTLSSDGITANLAISGSLPANFEVTINNVKDFAGNAIAANTKATGYTTGLAPDMVSYWPLDTIEGTKTPDIISGYDMNLVNLTAADLVNGRWGKCFQFDNSRQTLLRRVNNPTDLLPIYTHPALTVSLWVNGDLQTDHRVFCESSSKNNNPLFDLGTHNGGTDGTVDSFIRNDSGTTTGDHHHSAGTGFDTTWHHLCYVQNDTNITPRAILYIDGVADSVNPDPIWPLTVDTTAIGGVQRAAAAAWFTGLIDDVAMWARPLGADEVNFLYTKGTPTPPPKLLPLAVNSFTADLPAVAKGDSVALHWDVNKDVTSVVIQPDIGDVTALTQVGVGSTNVTVTASKTYQLTIKRGADSASSQIQVAAIDGVAAGWTLLDNFDRYAVGALPKPWGVTGAGLTVVDVNGNRMLRVGTGGDSMAGLPLTTLTVKEGDQRTLFARFYLAQDVAAGGVLQYMGLSDKGIRFYADSDGDLGPDVSFQNTDGPLQIGTHNGNGAALDYATFTFQTNTVYNLWIDIQNDPIDTGDLFSVFIAKDGDANRTTLFQGYRSDRNPNPPTSDIIGYPVKPDLTVLTAAANNATAAGVYFDDFYLSKSGYNSTVPRVYGFTTPSGGTGQAPTLKQARIQAGNLAFDLETQSGVSYVVETRASLSAGAWATAQPVAGTGQVITVSVPMSGNVQFCRVRVP